MGYVFATGTCFGCRRVFNFNPVKVPSVPADKTNSGTKEPVCRVCVDRANPRRIANGLQPITYADDAYEACHESELG